MQVGLTLPVTPDDGGNATWSHIERLASLADFGGADSLWLADHFLYHGSRGEVGFHEPFALLAAIAATTRRVALGTLVAAASFRSPGLLARTCVTLDAISSGRMILGLGSGWYEPEYRAFGYPFDHLVGQFEETAFAVRQLLDGERVTLDGRWLRLDDAAIVPAPARRIPLVVAAEGPRMMGLTARIADAWQAAWFARPDTSFRDQRARMAAAVRDHGNGRAIGVFVGLEVSDGDDEPSLPIDAGEISDALQAWQAEGVDHVQLGVHPGTVETFTIALDGIARYRAGRRDAGEP